MARPIAPTHSLKREEILDRAAELFARDGYASVSMQGLADSCGTSKAALYHYHRTKDALLFDLLDSYTQRLLLVVAKTEATAQRKALSERLALHELVRNTLAEYENAAARHAVLLTEARHLPPEQLQLITDRQRDLVSAFTRFLQRAYPMSNTQATARTMLLFGMINWTFTWLKPKGSMSYATFAELVISTLESGFNNP